MACERCGAQVAKDTVIISPVLRTPSGVPLHLRIVISSEPSVIGARGLMFCEACWLFFLGMLGEIGTAIRIKDHEARPS